MFHFRVCSNRQLHKFTWLPMNPQLITFNLNDYVKMHHSKSFDPFTNKMWQLISSAVCKIKEQYVWIKIGLGWMDFILVHLQKFWCSNFYTVAVYFSGAVCKLYFDLEYSILDNPESCGVRMVDLFIQVCLHVVKKPLLIFLMGWFLVLYF